MDAACYAVSLRNVFELGGCHDLYSNPGARISSKQDLDWGGVVTGGIIGRSRTGNVSIRRKGDCCISVWFLREEHGKVVRPRQPWNERAAW